MRSKLHPGDGDPEHLAYYRRLLALRRELGDVPCTDVVADEERRTLRWRRGSTELVANFSDAERDGVPGRTGQVRS